MELLPIIYSSLLIFAGLMISAILFSYAAHKIKKRKLPENSIEEEPVYLKPPTLTRGHTQTPMTPPSVKEKKKKSSSPIKKEKSKPAQRKVSKPAKKKESPKRYKVITHLSAPAKESPSISKKKKLDETPSALSSLGDNVIDKYIEDDGEKLFSLKTDKDKKPKK